MDQVSVEQDASLPTVREIDAGGGENVVPYRTFGLLDIRANRRLTEGERVVDDIKLIKRANSHTRRIPVPGEQVVGEAQGDIAADRMDDAATLPAFTWMVAKNIAVNLCRCTVTHHNS